MSEKINVLLLGSGGREAAIAWKLSQSPLLGNLYIAPGNAGTSACGTNIALKPTDFEAVAKAVKDNDIDLVIAGNEDPLVGGLREALAVSCPGVPMVGPGADGAALEGSKDFAKDFMGRHNIPTARHFTATKANIDEARAFLRSLKAPYVLKADGLAAGKGVLIIDDLDQAVKSLDEMLDGQFGAASAKVVIEEFLKGIECSVFVLPAAPAAWARFHPCPLPTTHSWPRSRSASCAPPSTAYVPKALIIAVLSSLVLSMSRASRW